MSKSTPISVIRVRFVPSTIVTIFSVLCLALIFTLSSNAAGVLIAGWGFEGVTTTNTGQTPTVSVGSATADSGALTAGSAFTAFHTSASTVWSNPAGNGSVKSVSSNNWGVGDYYQFSLSTSGYNAINITWDQTGSATGPRDFKVQYSTNGSTFTDATGTNSTYSLNNPAIAWSSSGSPNLPSRRTLDLSAVTALDNQATIYFRLVDTSTTAINGTTVAAAGTGRVDNFTVSGTAIAVGTFTLGVTRNGTGTGTVTSSPAGINCGGTCSASYNSGTSVILTATADVNSTFTSWSGCDSVSANTCTVAMTANRNVTATFTSSLRTLTVSRTGPGTGTVTSSPAGINCGATCSATYADGTVVNLTATAGANSTFNGWSGACTGSGACAITMDADKSATANFILTPPPANNVVISQVYGGGGNTGATLTNDYIELINHSSSPVNLSGWSVQAFVSTTGTWQVTPLTNFTLQPGQYYLIQESQGAGGTDPLPTPDAVGTIPVSSTSTKVALVNNTTTITAACPSAAAAGIVDLVGYGPTDCFEGSGTAPGLSNTTANFRLNGGCFDTNDNSVDFVTGSPNPHNTSSATHDCTGLSATGSANPSTVLQGNSTTLTVHVAPAQNPDSTGLTVTADLSLIGGSASQPFSGSGTTFTFVATVPANNPSGMKSLPVTIADGQSRTANTNIIVSVLSTTPEHVTISQVYGGGGNSGATYLNDYVELYNPTAAPITMTGWSLQYGSATGTSFSGKQVIGGTIDPGHYYLVSLASGGAVGAPLPQAAVSGGDINMAAGAGKIVLVSNSDTLIGACPVGSDPDIVDFVGYGTTANCHEGAANAPAPSNTTAIFRKNNGSTDTDQNGNDFLTGAPNPRNTTPPVEFGPSVAGTDPTTNAAIAPYDSSITADFSEPVDAVGVWYNVTCTNTGLHSDGTVAHSNDFKTWAFTPNTSFQFGEQCTATIYKDQIHDQDTDDSAPDTDTLSADYVWSFTVVGAGQAAPYPPSVHLTMGNPSNAVADLGQPLNYLMMKPTYAVSYNRDKGTPNWVSWHLDPSWYGTLARVDTFRPDPAVDPSWYRVQAFDYSGTGFDRGHMTPNADRDNQNRIPINQETYLMSNMVPQAPDNNQGPWANLEGDLRTIADGGNELYIISGPLGVGGVGSANGNTVNTIANGHVTVPAYTWKVALVLQSGSGDDVSRVTCSTRTIAVLMPNTQGIRNTPWQNFLTTVDAIEQATGYDLYSNLPPAVQACVEAGTNGANPPGTANQSAITTEDNAVTVTLQALQSNNNSLTFSIVDGPVSGSLGPVGSSSCSSGTCTATVTYTPGADFNGPDSFTFKASDGPVNSNTSTVNASVSEVNDLPSASNDSKSTQEDTALNFPSSDLTANDSAGPANESGQVLTVTSVTDTGNAHGTVALNSGVVTYTPAANYNGSASFDYQVCDDGTTNGAADSKCATATVNLTVSEVNNTPTAGADAKSTAEDNSLDFSASDLTANDSAGPADESGQTLTVSSVTATANTHGTVSLSSGTVHYVPDADYNGVADFEYQVCDNGTTNGSPDSKCATGTVNVTVSEVNDNPSAGDDSKTSNEDASLNFAASDLTTNDSAGPANESGQTLTVTSVTSTANTHGSVLLSSGQITYTPAANYNGPASFEYAVCDNGTTNGSLDSKCANGTVNVTIGEANDSPAANADGKSTNEDTSLNFAATDLTANDSAGPANESGQTLTVTSVTSTANTHGSVSLSSGTVSYSPAANYNGPADFSYQVCDNGTTNGSPDSKCATGTVNVTVNPVNDAPTANSQSVSTNWNMPVAITLTGNDLETPSANLTYTVTSGPSHGGLSGTGANRTYTPALNYSGPDSFKFTVTDGGDGASPPLTSSEATVSITVNCPQLTSLGPASVWLGLKNSDDVGTKFDLLAEVLKNGTVIGSGQLNDVPGGGSGFNNAVQRSITQTLSSAQSLCPGDALSIRLSVRVAASSSHVSGTARLWFNDSQANSRFSATISGGTGDYYLRSGFALATTPGPGPKATIDVTVNRNQGGNPFKPFGTWSITF